MVEIKEESPTKDTVDMLIGFSREWAAEENVYGYRANEASDIEGNRIFVAYLGSEPVGYLFGKGYKSKNMNSIMPDGTDCFEIEELYVIKRCRSSGIGKLLMQAAYSALTGEYEYVTLSTASKNHKSILHFYIDEVGMEFFSARLYKKL